MLFYHVYNARVAYMYSTVLHESERYAPLVAQLHTINNCITVELAVQSDYIPYKLIKERIISCFHWKCPIH